MHEAVSYTHLRLAVAGGSLTQLTENGDDTTDFIKGRFLCRQLHHFLEALHAAADNVNFFLKRVGQREDDRVETAFQCA